MKLVTLLQIAGILHLALLSAGITMPKVVNMRTHLELLPPFLRQLFWTYYLFIGATITGYGMLTFFYAEQLAAAEPLARAMAGFLALFWLFRLYVAGFVFKMKPYLTCRMFKVGYLLLNLLFVFLVIVYALTALKLAPL